MPTDTTALTAPTGRLRATLRVIRESIGRILRFSNRQDGPATARTAIDAAPTVSGASSAPRSTPTARPTIAASVLGWGCIVAGGLVAAVTAPLQLVHGSWCAAYLVLVGGAAQVAMGRAQAHLATRPADPSRTWTQLATWNLGNALVILGTFVTAPFVVDAGGVALLVSLVLAVQGVPGAQRSWLGRGYLAVLAVLLVSMPIGLVLAHIRA